MSLEEKYKDIIDEYAREVKENPKFEAGAIAIGNESINLNWNITIWTKKKKEIIKGLRIKEGREASEELAKLINYKSRSIN